MPEGKTVSPAKWQNIIVLYDNGAYSAIWGNYDGSDKRCLGVRWNGGEDELGYPNMAGNPVWYVEPNFLTEQILLKLLRDVNNDTSHGSVDDILIALREC